MLIKIFGLFFWFPTHPIIRRENKKDFKSTKKQKQNKDTKKWIDYVPNSLKLYKPKEGHRANRQKNEMIEKKQG